MKILSTTYYAEFPAWTLPDWAVDELRSTFPDIEVVKLTSKERVFDEISDTDVLLRGRTRWKVPGPKKLKWIHTGMAGLNWILIPAVVNSDIVVTHRRAFTRFQSPSTPLRSCSSCRAAWPIV